jgi:arylformamidase
MIHSLSYPLSRDSPLYPGTPKLSIYPLKSLERGDSSNSSMISLPGHAGTHIDLPKHFCKGGRSVQDILEYGTKLFPVYCLDIPKNPGELLCSDDFKNCTLDKNARGILIRTGFFRYRTSDQQIYTQKNPGVHPDVADLIRTACPNLFLFGIDAISISNPGMKAMGHASHRSFLCHEKPILLLEDSDLSEEELVGSPFNLWLYPMVYDDIDGISVIALAVR